MRWIAVVAVVAWASPAAAEVHVKSTALTLSRQRDKPTRLLAKKIDVEVLRAVPPCSLRLVVEPQHPLFKRFSIVIPYQPKSAISVEVLAVDGVEPIVTKRGHVLVSRKKHELEAKLDATFDHGSSQWLLTGTVRFADDECE